MSVTAIVASALRRRTDGASLLNRVLAHIAADVSQLILWSPVLFASGIGWYFLLPFEPRLLTSGLSAVLAIICAHNLRRRPAWSKAFMAVALVFAGFFAATLRTEMLDTKVLTAETRVIELAAIVTDIERRPNGTFRLTLSDVTAGDERSDLPDKIRLTVRTAVDDIVIGDSIRTRAVLMPPSGPAIPDGFDFARQAWFQGLGAVGYTVAAVTKEGDTTSGTGPLLGQVTALRIAISERIRVHLDEPAAGIAIALMTGRREAISDETYSVFRDSGIAHILALSGLHMGLVAGLLFFATRAMLAMWEKGALRYPIKKWAAAVTLLGCFFYLFVGGMSVSIQRAFIMTGFVLFAVIVDRTAISMHRVAWAALVVLLVAPESLMQAGFQMSFAAVVALIAFYERYGRVLLSRARSMSLIRRAGLYLAAAVLTTLVSDIATAPFAAFHFNRVAGLGILTNLFAVPLVGGWIMPCALAAYFLMPIGLEQLALVPMGWGIDILFAGARVIASRPESVFLIPAIPSSAFVIFIFGGLWLCLWRQKWRRLGLLPMVMGVVLAWMAPRPDILVTYESDLAAVRLTSGELSLSKARGASYVRGKWMQREGIAEVLHWDDPDSQALGAPKCDDISCAFSFRGTKTVFVRDARALAEDCQKADLLIATFPVPPTCSSPGMVIDLWDLRESGTHAIYFAENGLKIVTVAAERGARPWTVGN